MRAIKTPIPDLLILEPVRHQDGRGFFMEIWRAEWQKHFGFSRPFIQDNHARSDQRGVLRGLHFQAPPQAQAKIVWASRGAIYDVAVDLRRGSPSFGKWHALVLSSENSLRFFLPSGFAHGYMALEAGTDVQYKVDAYYSPEAEKGLRWDDPLLGISWPAIPPLVSERDAALPGWKDFSSPFTHGQA
ncbi:MAG: dTDP-4-dehydrorhamnose 3,5-epimerase [Deltaproteobacteria bacterium]|jgi:dTDP-4-dehydrorhamnose 3,5-epimerase|nr:dTDP-4-dehydrorhamnose 3,5-epimerase [Deltaproteobacteria bacterium]